MTFTPNISVTTFTIPPTLTIQPLPWALTFTLTVTDTGNLSDTDTIVVTVTEELHTLFLPLLLRN